MIVKYEDIDNAFDAAKQEGYNVRWEGWDMIFFFQKKDAFRSPTGRRHGGEWGFETRVTPDNDGRWRIPKENVKTGRPIRFRYRKS